MRSAVVLIAVMCVASLVVWLGVTRTIPPKPATPNPHATTPRPEPVTPPPTPAELQQTHALKGANVEADYAWIGVGAPGGARIDHVLFGDIGAGDYAHVKLTDDPGAFRIRDGSCRRISGPVAAGRVTTVSRTGDVVRLYEGNRSLAAFDAPAGPVQLVMVTPENGADDSWTFAVQDVTSLSFADDFMRTTFGDADGWTPVAGRWWIDQEAEKGASPNAFSLQVRTEEGPAEARTGRSFWNNYRYAAAVNVRGDGVAGLSFAHDGDACWRLLMASGESADTVRLVRVRGETQSVAAETTIAPKQDRWAQLAVHAGEGRAIAAFVDGVELLSAEPDGALFGEVGLFADGKGARFDDLTVTDLRHVAGPDALRPVVKFSKTYQTKPRFQQDDRDDFLQRWASDTDAWGYQKIHVDGADLRGWLNSTELFGDLSVKLDPRRAERVVVLHGSEAEVLLARAFAPSDEPDELRVREGVVSAGGKRIGRIAPASWVRVGFYATENVPFTSELPELLSRNVRQDFFEQAPYDWFPVAGRWELTNRWQCKPKWNFFGGIGPDDVVLFDKTAYTGDQCHEFYYGMKDVFGRQFESRRYARHDVNVSFCTNGRDLNSGYTFLYGGFDNKASALLKGDRVVAWNEEKKFNPFVDIDDLHTFWWRMRIEKTGRRIVIRRDDEVIFDWTDPAPDAPWGGQLALWTVKNGIMYARVKSTAQGMADRAGRYLSVDGKARAGGWASLDPARVRLRDRANGRVRVVNQYGGGAMAVKWTGAGSVDLNTTPRLVLPMALGDGARVNLHAVVGGRAMVLTVNAPTGKTSHVLGTERPDVRDWQLYVPRNLGVPIVGGPEVYDAEAGRVAVDLLAEATRRFPDLTDATLTSLIIGNADNTDYLLAGFNGNASDAWYEVGAPSFRPAAE